MCVYMDMFRTCVCGVPEQLFAEHAHLFRCWFEASPLFFLQLLRQLLKPRGIRPVLDKADVVSTSKAPPGACRKPEDVQSGVWTFVGTHALH